MNNFPIPAPSQAREALLVLYRTQREQCHALRHENQQLEAELITKTRLLARMEDLLDKLRLVLGHLQIDLDPEGGER